MRPAYMTMTRSVIPATTAKSWVMSSMVAPCSVVSSWSSSKIWAWTVTSRAVVGSSATSRPGRGETAMAITARCRMPPENWWG